MAGSPKGQVVVLMLSVATKRVRRCRTTPPAHTPSIPADPLGYAMGRVRWLSGVGTVGFWAL